MSPQTQGKSSALWISGIVVLVIVVAVLIWLFWWPSSTTPDEPVSATTTTEEDSTLTPVDTNLSTFTDADLGFSLSVPAGLTAQTSVTSTDFTGVIFVDASDVLGLQAFRIPAEVALADYLYLDFAATSEGTLDGEAAVVIEALDGYADGPDDAGLPFVAYVAEYNGQFYHLIFYGDTTLSAVEQAALDSFKFL